jgi:leucyl aminopeptidase
MGVTVEVGSGDPTRANIDGLVVCVAQGGLTKSPWVKALDQALGGGLVTHAKGAEFEGKQDQLLDVPTFGRIKPRRVLLLGTGDRAEPDAARTRATLATGVRAACGSGVKSIGIVVASGEDFRTLGEGAVLGAYRFTKYFTGERKPKDELKKIALFSGERVTPAEKRALGIGTRVAEAVCLARDAVNEPPNVLYPETLASIARSIAKTHKLKIKVLDKRGIKAAGMNLHYAVGQGSAHEPRFIHLTYLPKKKKKKLVFVGKGPPSTPAASASNPPPAWAT